MRLSIYPRIVGFCFGSVVSISVPSVLPIDVFPDEVLACSSYPIDISEAPPFICSLPVATASVVKISVIRMSTTCALMGFILLL